MQELKLDLSIKKGIDLVFAKQRDVGSKILIRLTDNKEEYVIPADVTWSVWFSGKSGEGNYDKIDGRDAVKVEGSTATVELIYQMLNNPGPGEMCLVMNGADGTRLGLWNIPYYVEAIPGADSEAATAYYQAFLDAQAKAEAAAGRAEAAAAKINVDQEYIETKVFSAGQAAEIAAAAARDAAKSEQNIKGDAERAEGAADNAEAAEKRTEEIADSVGSPVSYKAQTLTPEQQSQARENIGAPANLGERKILGVNKIDNSVLENGIVTFVTDDGCKQDYSVYKPLFASMGVPFCTAVKTNSVGKDGYATLPQLLEIQTDGNEILSHTVNHLHLSELATEEEVESELKNSKDWLLNNGLACETLCFPYGFWGEREKRIARKYYRAARCSDYGVNGLNQSPIETFELKCIWLDSAAVLPNDPSGFEVNTLEYYKHYIDKAVAENAWLIIGSHSNDVEIAGLTQVLSDVVSYAKENSNVMTFKQALDVVGNVLEVGSISKVKPFNPYFAVGYDGRSTQNEIGFSFVDTNTFDGNSTIDEFPYGKITMNKVIASVAVSSNLPENLAGTMFTYKTATREETEGSSWGFNYQIYIVHGSGNQYNRVLKNDKTWGPWNKQTSSIYLKDDIGTNFNKPISTYDVGITLNVLMGANASLSPSGTAGTLITIKPRETTLALCRQIFFVYNSQEKYERYNIDGATWSAWKSSHGVTATNTVDGNTSIASFDMGVTYSPVNTAMASASGLPESIAGTIVTYKVNPGNHAYNYQTYHVYGSAKLYKRSFNESGTPTEWAKISSV